jgi:acyl-CoA synthetase (AMP-forming)/AMP-acid ligase II
LADVNTRALREALATQLPAYMVPAAYEALDALPVTPNGKIDRLALRARPVGRVPSPPVQVRGHRFDPGEVEAALNQLPSIKQCVADFRQGRLIAYVVLQDDEEMTPSEVRAALRTTLPDYMVPSLVVTLDRPPLTQNGTIDRSRLPDPLRMGFRSEQRTLRPTTPAEVAIAQVWQEILGVSQVSTNDNFFELGGHSLLSVQAVQKIRERTGWQPDPRLFFFETLAKIAAAMPDPRDA